MPRLIIQENTCFQLNNFYIAIKSLLGRFADVDYYKVSIQEVSPTNLSINFNANKLGLLRIGDINGGLSRELQLRHVLKESKLISELLTFGLEEVELLSTIPIESYLDRLNYPNLDAKLISQIVPENITNNPNDISPQLIDSFPESSSNESYFDGDWEAIENYEYLEEDTENINVLPNSKLILLSELPTEGQTLDIWLQEQHSYAVALELTNQVGQLFNQAYQQGWCFFQIIPQFIQGDSTIKFFDLTNVCLVGERFIFSRETNYCAPEIASDRPINEAMSVYIIGTLLYQAIYQQLPAPKLNYDYLNVQPIPGIYQIISLCLSPIEEGISLNQLVKALGETKQTFSNYKVQWDVVSRSTIGLSRQRLHNEDNYSIQQYSSSYKDVILAVLADGMGGLAQGEIASQLAVKTVIETPIDCLTDSEEQCNEWLVSVVKKANKYVTEKVHKGGTTLSIAWVNSRQLRIAHIGDSRIYLIRNQMICQLSEDHSLVAMLLADGDITYEESHKHPQRNILTRCIGSKEKLSSSHIQTLQSFGSNSSIFLEQGDIIILCSDGVWDLVPQIELAEIFTESRNLKIAVNNIINLVLVRGARDNATILAMRCNLSNQY